MQLPHTTRQVNSQLQEQGRDALMLIIKKAIADNSGQACPDDMGVFMDCDDIDHAAEEAADEIIKGELEK